MLIGGALRPWDAAAGPRVMVRAANRPSADDQHDPAQRRAHVAVDELVDGAVGSIGITPPTAVLSTLASSSITPSKPSRPASVTMNEGR